MKFIINTFTHWDEPPRARHQVAFALAKNHTVVFVAANKIGIPAVKTTPVQNNLTLVQPRFFVGNKIRYRIPFYEGNSVKREFVLPVGKLVIAKDKSVFNGMKSAMF